MGLMHTQLASKLEAMIRVDAVPADHIRRFGDALSAGEARELYRINPIRFAALHGFQPREAVDLMVLAAWAGLLDFDWNVLCPACGGVLHSDETIDQVRSDGRCHLCQIDVEAALDDQVEVSFTMNPGVQRVALDPFTDAQAYLGSFFSPNYEKSPLVDAYVRSCIRGFYPLEAGAMLQVAVDLATEGSYRLVNLDRHSVCAIVGDDQAPPIATVEVTEHGLPQGDLRAPSGPVTLLLRNTTARKTAVLLIDMDYGHLYGLVGEHPTRVQPFLSGTMLLNNQLFRELFRVQSANRALRLNVRSLTLLFTDLRGSTALYDRIGDMRAYELIQSHFRLLTAVVRAHDGAIVKTMGDAVMATFSTPREGVLAATDMAREMQGLVSRESEDGLGLKIGLHAGPALAINADDRVDYFGHTVNIVARVQALADAGELVVTESAHAALGVSDALSGAAVLKEKASVSLRGIAEPTPVLRYALG